MFQKDPFQITFSDLRNKTFKVFFNEIFEHDYLLINFTNSEKDSISTGEVVITIINKKIVGLVSTIDFVNDKCTIDPSRYSYREFDSVRELLTHASMIMRDDPFVGIVWLKDNLIITDEDGEILDEELRKKFEEIERNQQNGNSEENGEKNDVEENEEEEEETNRDEDNTNLKNLINNWGGKIKGNKVIN